MTKRKIRSIKRKTSISRELIKAAVRNTKRKPNIILWDLETMPDMEKVMAIFPSIGNWPGRTFKAELSSIICFGYKKLGDKKAKCINAWDYPGWKKNINDDLELVKAAYDILKDADEIVTHNGKSFDVKVLNTRLLFHGLPPLPKIMHTDTKVEAGKVSFYSKRLGDVSKFFNGGGKLENGGWDLWVQVRKRSRKAMKLMTQYCKQDVIALEEVYIGLLPLMSTGKLNHNIFNKKGDIVCPNCGSDKLIGNGMRTTKTDFKKRLRCKDCGTSLTVSKQQKVAAVGV